MSLHRIVVAAVLAAGVLVENVEGQATSTRDPAANPRSQTALPGLQVGPAPWPNGVGDLSARLDIIGLPAMPAEAFVQHIHQRLTITINGTPTTVPAQIGISRFPQFISPIHTHDTTGTIHIEAATTDAFNLGQFFDVWGVRLTAQCIGGYCTRGPDSLKVVSNGNPVSGDPRKVALQDHEIIEITFGRPHRERTAKTPPKSP